jgi:hypothetical protein
MSETVQSISSNVLDQGIGHPAGVGGATGEAISRTKKERRFPIAFREGATTIP